MRRRLSVVLSVVYAKKDDDTSDQSNVKTAIEPTPTIVNVIGTTITPPDSKKHTLPTKELEQPDQMKSVPCKIPGVWPVGCGGH